MEASGAEAAATAAGQPAAEAGDGSRGEAVRGASWCRVLQDGMVLSAVVQGHQQLHNSGTRQWSAGALAATMAC